MSQKITDIQPQKKREGYYSIFINGEYSFSLSELDVSIAGLRISEELDTARLVELQKLSQQSKIYSRAIYYLRYGPRTVWQMQEYLSKKAYFEPDDVLPVLERLQKDGLLNDAAYIEAYVNSRQLSRPRSKRQLQAELIKKGVSSASVNSYLRDIDDESQKEAAKAVMQKKLQIPRFRDKDKLTQYMLRQGFPYGLVKEVIAEANWEIS